MKRSIFAMAAVAALSVIWPASIVIAAGEHAGHQRLVQADKVHQGKGTVEAVDLAGGVITMEHEAIESLRWPKMVMEFKARNPAQLKGFKAGDRVEFDLVKTGKEYRITRIAPLR